MQWNYDVVDVFTQRPLEGNPLAVFHDARGLDDDTMQRIARELNLSETTFVFAPTSGDAAARVRIFTPRAEMRFAGHPTIGTAFVMRRHAIVDPSATAFALEEPIGIVPVRVDERGMIWLQTPAIAFGRTFERADVARAVGVPEADILPSVPCQIVTAGNPMLFVAVRDPHAVDRAEVNAAEFHALVRHQTEATCVFLFAATAEGAYSRMFAPELGIIEDPATGSATGPLAAFMMRNELAESADGTRFVSEQGTKMGRRSMLHVLVRGDAGRQGIEVGGFVTPVATATLSLEG